jgi:hypothetical protein
MAPSEIRSHVHHCTRRGYPPCEDWPEVSCPQTTCPVALVCFAHVCQKAGLSRRVQTPRKLDGAACQTESWAVMDVPVQYFQSVIAIELAVSGALLWQMRFFESSATRREGEPLPDARLRVGLALVMGATVFGSLWAMADEGPKWAALLVTIGLAVSLVPILLRVLPPLAKDAKTNERDPDYAVTLVGLFFYVVAVAGVLLLLDIQ